MVGGIDGAGFRGRSVVHPKDYIPVWVREVGAYRNGGVGVYVEDGEGAGSVEANAMNLRWRNARFRECGFAAV